MNTTTRFLQTVLACIFVSSFMTGCGFHLRGSHTDATADVANNFTVTTEADDEYDLFYVALHHRLEKDRLLPSDAIAPDFIVHVGIESIRLRTMTVSTDGHAADNEITMEVPIVVMRNGNAVAINKVSARRIYLNNTNAQLFSDRQVEALKVEMRTEISQRVVEQLRLLYRNPKPAAPTIPAVVTPSSSTDVTLDVAPETTPVTP